MMAWFWIAVLITALAAGAALQAVLLARSRKSPTRTPLRRRRAIRAARRAEAGRSSDELE